MSIYLVCRINIAEAEGCSLQEQWLECSSFLEEDQEVITCKQPVLLFRIRE